MTTRYRVEYALKTHRRDQFIEWIKGLLAVPFVLYSQPQGIFEGNDDDAERMAEEAARRYGEIMRDVEKVIDDHIALQTCKSGFPSKLKLLVPGAGPFFTRLPLEAAFKVQDGKRYISSRRFVAPSFNDVRLVLNSAQLMAVAASSKLRLATFDGDVTLYDDGKSLEADSPLISRIIDLMRRDVCIGIVTAAGYTTPDRYHERLHGLLNAVAASTILTAQQKHNLVVMGGEANFFFSCDHVAPPYYLRPVPQAQWLTPEMASWSMEDITTLLDIAEKALKDCIRTLNLPATLLRKSRAVGLIPNPPTARIPRESLEETVLVVQKILEISAPATARDGRKGVPFCAFNGGRDVFVDIGDKSWGVTVCQEWFSTRNGHQAIRSENTLHVGDQFLSAGANDFRARSVGTTAWIASPEETVDLLDELAALMGRADEP